MPPLASSEHAENITALKCITANGWIITLLFIFKGKKFMEAWYDKAIPNYYTAVTDKGYINEEITLK
ncbi:hypothetical protein EYZ11_011826 [Aspergillus tanneri]|uniref:Uncharacterized protein n=1 Tax=Aspergillus tanneri TaxID=1220188 RepID=A0A4S3J1V8_9EURO|nr:hypothetical protein EYZ11_011826 [Aspergillus tanneri]